LYDLISITEHKLDGILEISSSNEPSSPLVVFEAAFAIVILVSISVFRLGTAGMLLSKSLTVQDEIVKSLGSVSVAYDGHTHFRKLREHPRQTGPFSSHFFFLFRHVKQPVLVLVLGNLITALYEGFFGRSFVSWSDEATVIV